MLLIYNDTSNNIAGSFHYFHIQISTYKHTVQCEYSRSFNTLLFCIIQVQQDIYHTIYYIQYYLGDLKCNICTTITVFSTISYIRNEPNKDEYNYATDRHLTYFSKTSSWTNCAFIYNQFVYVKFY